MLRKTWAGLHRYNELNDKQKIGFMKHENEYSTPQIQRVFY
jgi:hypothetical protein